MTGRFFISMFICSKQVEASSLTAVVVALPVVLNIGQRRLTGSRFLLRAFVSQLSSSSSLKADRQTGVVCGGGGLIAAKHEEEYLESLCAARALRSLRIIQHAPSRCVSDRSGGSLPRERNMPHRRLFSFFLSVVVPYHARITAVLLTKEIHAFVLCLFVWCLQAATSAAAPASTAGPSKNAAKKAEKAAKKAAAKGAKSGAVVPPTGSSSAPSPSPSAAAAAAAGKAAKAAAGPSLPSVYLSSAGPGPLKCLTAAKFFGVDVEAANMNPAGKLEKKEDGRNRREIKVNI